MVVTYNKADIHGRDI